MRKAIALATITLSIKQYVDDGGVTHIDIQQSATGGINTTELRTLDWVVRFHEDRVFGKVDGQTRWIKLEDVDDDDFLKTGWDDLEGEHVQSYVKSQNNGWTANQVRYNISMRSGAERSVLIAGIRKRKISAYTPPFSSHTPRVLLRIQSG